MSGIPLLFYRRAKTFEESTNSKIFGGFDGGETHDRAERAFGEMIGAGNVFRKIDAVRKERKKEGEKRREREAATRRW